MGNHISFRFRKELDSDLIEAISTLNRTEVADLCRQGLRIMLGIKMFKEVTVQEKPIETRSVVERKTEPVMAKPKLFTPPPYKP